MLSRPTFIFLDEDHRSPFSGSLLAKLAPRFKQNGYHNFYAECSNVLSSEQLINEFEDIIKIWDAGKTILPTCKQEILEFITKNQMYNNQKNYELLIEHFTSILNNIQYKGDMADFYYYFYLCRILTELESCTKEYGKDRMDGKEVERILSRLTLDFITFGSAAEANIRLIRAINDNQIAFKGILELEVSHDARSTNTSSDAVKDMEELLEAAIDVDKLDKQLVAAYLRANAPVIGLNGSLHVTGLQKLLVTMIPEEIAKANFNFIYAYREPLNASTSFINKHREDLRNNKLPLPLGIILIDGMNKAEDKIVEEVTLRMHEIISEYETLPDHLKIINDNSLTGMARHQLSNLYGLFSHAKDSVYQTAVDAVERVRGMVPL